MQKKLIALALASLAGSAFAQSNVTVYGVLDGTMEYLKTTGATTTGGEIAGQSRLSSNSSLLGFKGTEDLGNGLKAVFQLETGIDFTGNNDGTTAAAGSSGIFNGQVRDSFVGLNGGFGTIVAGTLTHPIRAMGAKVDFNPGASSSGFAGTIYGEVLGVKSGADDRSRNSVAYVSPSFSGLTVTGVYVSGSLNPSEDGNADARNAVQNPNRQLNSNQYQLAAQYENGPVYAGLGYHYAKDPRALTSVLAAFNAATGNTDALAAYDDKLQVLRAAGKFSLPTGTTFSALYDVQKYNFDMVGFGGDLTVKRAAWMVGANQSFGKNNVYAQYARAHAAKADGENLDDTGASQFTVGYTYDLSKRTMVHAFYTRLNNNANVKYDFYVNGANSAAVPMGIGADPKVLGAGLRHAF